MNPAVSTVQFVSFINGKDSEDCADRSAGSCVFEISSGSGLPLGGIWKNGDLRRQCIVVEAPVGGHRGAFGAFYEPNRGKDDGRRLHEWQGSLEIT